MEDVTVTVTITEKFWEVTRAHRRLTNGLKESVTHLYHHLGHLLAKKIHKSNNCLQWRELN